jgi:hypothetical protein
MTQVESEARNLIECGTLYVVLLAGFINHHVWSKEPKDLLYLVFPPRSAPRLRNPACSRARVQNPGDAVRDPRKAAGALENAPFSRTRARRAAAAARHGPGLRGM